MEKQQKDERLTEAMRIYGNYLLKLCYTYVHNWTVAEDLVQDTFVKYYEKMEQFREEAAVKTYLYRIAINHCHNYLTSWRYTKLQIIDYWHKLISHGDEPEVQLLAQEADAFLVHAIERLPTKYKDVLLLFHFAEFSLKEIAVLVRLPENTVKTRLRRARQMVGVTLQEEGFENGFDS
ncbi:sigma-70 family RNA polymerase sigma factor [Lysinibacillus piscis]|uniref:RNA polymerase subunit sigma n=1 Tax=Lysinibacillus piscis TaxID=2518931 RepID=A0ABQ5NKH9_9BACI|nr:sigma-70 family RNA polymerase sigma factor [Lysinibacillus sp. KH24]GLC88875.1 RNA polymerase subunit sigma [Lysinibacillus sp. KH24]